MNEKILTYEEAERKIAQAKGAKIVVRKECGVADIYNIFKDKYIGTVGDRWAEFMLRYKQFLILRGNIIFRLIKDNDTLTIFEMEVI